MGVVRRCSFGGITRVRQWWPGATREQRSVSAGNRPLDRRLSKAMAKIACRASARTSARRALRPYKESLFGYSFFRNGDVVDEYAPIRISICPSRAAISRPTPEQLRELLPNDAAVTELNRIPISTAAAERDGQRGTSGLRRSEVARQLVHGVPRREDLSRVTRTGSRSWWRFEHVPDLRAVRGSKGARPCATPA